MPFLEVLAEASITFVFPASVYECIAAMELHFKFFFIFKCVFVVVYRKE